MSRGINRERRLRDTLGAEGWWTCRAAGSFGEADIVALKQGELPRLVEVKSTARGPFAGFGPAKRLALISAAAQAGAAPWLVWWPVRQPARWIHVKDWPAGPAELEGDA